MGVRRSDYILIGVNLDDYIELTEEFEEELYNKYGTSSKNKEIKFLRDSYNEKYKVLGYVIRSDDKGYEGLGFNIINQSTIYKNSEIAKSNIKEIIGIDVEPKLIVVTHWH